MSNRWVFDCAAVGLHCEPKRVLKPFCSNRLLDAGGCPFRTMEEESEATTWRTNHAFGARCGLSTRAQSREDVKAGKPRVTRSPEEYREWYADFQLRSFSAEPHVLLSVGPRYFPSRETDGAVRGATSSMSADHCHSLGLSHTHTAEEQEAYDTAVLGTPLIWEKPFVVSLECTARGLFLWSEDYGLYGEKVADRCFELRNMEPQSPAGDVPAQPVSEAVLRLGWKETPAAQPLAVSDGGRKTQREEPVESANVGRCGELSVFQRHSGKPSTGEELPENSITSRGGDVPSTDGATLWRQVLHRVTPCGFLPEQVYFTPYPLRLSRMPLQGHPYCRYIPVKLTHTHQDGENNAAGNGGELVLDNEDKWRAFGIEVEVNKTPTSPETLFARRVIQPGAANGGVSSDRVVKGQGSLCSQLAALTSRVGQTREQIFNASRSGETLSSKGTSTNCTPSSQSTNTDKIGGDSTSLSLKRGREGVDTAQHQSTRKLLSTPKGTVALEKESGCNVTVQQKSDKRTKTKPRRSSTVFDAAGVAAARPATKTLPQRTLFTLPTVSTASVPPGVQVTFKEELDSSALFEDARNTLNDPNRFQVPTIFVAFATRGGDTNFTISSTSRGKVHFTRGVNPELSHLEVSFIAVRWKDHVVVFSADVGLQFLVQVAEELQGVEIVTFNAPSLLLPLLSYKQGKLFTSCVSDIRLMSWMLEPSADTEAFADYDRLLQCYQRQIGLPAGFGALENSASKQAVSCRVFYMEPLYRVLYGKLGSRGLLPAFLKQEKRISIMCAAMKLNGFYVNLVEVDEFKARCTERMQELRDEARSMVPSMTDFNIQSSDDCRIALYDILKLGENITSKDADGSRESSTPVLTKGGKLSTSEDTLKLLSRHHRFPRILIAYRRVAKLLQTYIVGLMEMAVHIEDGDDEFADVSITETRAEPSAPGAADRTKARWAKLYPNMVQEGTETGRLTSVEPNMQSLPRPAPLNETETTDGNGSKDREHNSDDGPCNDDNDKDGGEANEERSVAQAKDTICIRRCFAAPEGHSLVALDYEQVELRILAHLSGDSALINILTRSGDIHRTIAETIFRKEAVTLEERSLAKRVVFGMLYGAGPRGLAQQMGVSVDQALRLSLLFKSFFPTVDMYQRRVVEQCRVDGFVRTLSGRVRPISDINDPVLVKRSHAERQAFNTVVQGSAADVMKLGMIAVEREVLQPYAPDVRLLLQVHDEIVLSIPNHMLYNVVPIVMHAFAHPISLLVPLRVTTKVGRRLGDMEDWTVDHALGLRVPA